LECQVKRKAQRFYTRHILNKVGEDGLTNANVFKVASSSSFALLIT